LPVIVTFTRQNSNNNKQTNR